MQLTRIGLDKVKLDLGGSGAVGMNRGVASTPGANEVSILEFKKAIGNPAASH